MITSKISCIFAFNLIVAMFERLKKKWNVNGTQFFLIMCVFAITGTTTAYITRQITRWLELESHSIWYWVLKVFVLIFGYQVLILIISIPFGQFKFFWDYEKKILRWFAKVFGIKKANTVSAVENVR